MVSEKATVLECKYFYFLLFVGVLIRFLWAVFVDPEQVSDSAVYLSRAEILSNEGRYQYANGELTAYWPVGYAAFLSAFLSVFDNARVAIVISNMLLQIGILVALYLLAKNISRSTKVALLALAYFVFLPDQIAYTSLTSSELLASFLTMFFLIAVLRAKAMASYFFAGIVLGFAVLTKAQTILLLPLVFIFLLVERINKDSVLRLAKFFLVALVGCALVVAPWTTRNYQAFGEFIPVSTNGGVNLFIGNNPDSIGRYVWTDRMQDEFHGLNEVERDIKAGRLAKQYILDEPTEFFSLVPIKIFYLLKSDGDGLSWNQDGLVSRPVLSEEQWFYAKVVATLYYYLALFFAFAGTIFFIRKSILNNKINGEILLSVIVLYYISIHAAVYGASRYHDIFVPFLTILAASFISELFIRFRFNTRDADSILEARSVE